MPAPGITRQSLVTGPAAISFNGASLFTKQDVTININQRTMNIDTSAHGKVDERVIDIDLETSFVPEGRWNASTIAALWPYANTVYGTSIFGSTDTNCVFSAADTEVHTIIAAAVVRMPSIFLSASKTLVGPVGIRGVRANGDPWSTASSIYTIATSGGSVVDSTFSPSLIIVQPYVGTWGSVTGFTSVQTQLGWTIEFNLTLAPIEVDAFGIIDYRFQQLEVMARCVPIGPTSTQLLTAQKIQGSGAARGTSLNANGNTLTITGDDGVNYVVINNAAIKTAGYRFGATTLRNGELGFVATRNFTTGVQQPLFVLAHE